MCRNSAELNLMDLCSQNHLLRGWMCCCPSWWDFSGIRGSQWAAGSWRRVIFKSGEGHVCAAVGASARQLSGGIYSIFNNKEVLFPFGVTAASSALSVVSPDLLALFILIRLALALSEAENPMSLLIRKWHPLWIRLAAWKVKICQWLQKLRWRRMTVAISYDGRNIIRKESAASVQFFYPEQVGCSLI